MTSIISNSSRAYGKVVILGASGKLGSMLRHFWSDPDDLVCHSRTSRPGFVNFDLLEEPQEAAVALRGARAVICLSGLTPASAGSSDMELNVILACAAVERAHRAGAQRVFIASSAAVYGPGQTTMSESAACAPVSDYGRAKLRMEQEAGDLAASLGIAATSLRIGNVVGADAIVGGWHPAMQLDRFADGRTPQRSYIGPRTLCRVFETLCEVQDLPGVVNIATPGTIEMGKLLDAADLGWAARPAPDTAIRKVALCTDLLERYVTFSPAESRPAGMIAEWQEFQYPGQART